MGQIALGIDIGGTSVKAAALRDQQVIWTARSPRFARPSREQLADAIRQACKQMDGPATRVGLCVPGILDAQRHKVTCAINMPGIVNVPLDQLLGEALGVSTTPLIANDAHAAAYDIYCTRKPSGRLLLIAIGTGVGAAVLDDGIPLRVDGDSPGHLGQIDVSMGGRPVVGPDGGRGGLEGYVGARALRSRYGPDPASKIRPSDQAFAALVRAIRICHAIYRPHHVCLAGGMGIRLRDLVEALRESVARELTRVARPDWSLFTGDSDFHSAAGAARLAMSATGPEVSET